MLSCSQWAQYLPPHVSPLSVCNQTPGRTAGLPAAEIRRLHSTKAEREGGAAGKRPVIKAVIQEQANLGSFGFFKDCSLHAKHSPSKPPYL